MKMLGEHLANSKHKRILHAFNNKTDNNETVFFHHIGICRFFLPSAN